MKKLLCFVTGILFLIHGSPGQSCKNQSETKWNYDLKGIRVLMVIYEGFDYDEAVDITDYWEKWGARVDIAGTGNNPHGERNNKVTVSLKTDLLLTDADYHQYDLIYFPGGEGVREFLQTSREDLRALIDGAVSANKYVAAICNSPLLLAASESLRGHTVTVQGREFKPDLVKSGASIVNKMVVSDGFFMTGKWPYSETFAVSVAEKLLYPEGNGPFEIRRKRNSVLAGFLISSGRH